MADILQKLRPDRDLQCYFLRPSAVAALSGASANGFTISGSWRQQFDWVVIEWNRDNTFEHPAFRNLPDGDLSGVILSYEETRTNCIPIDSTLYATVDWPSLRVWAEADGAETLYKVPIKENAVPVAGGYQAATATFTLTGTITAGDYIELAWSGEHYTYKIAASDTLESAAQAVVDAINQAPSPTMTAARNGTQITLTYAVSAAGANANRIGVYGNVQGAMTESWQPWFQQLSGGTSPTQWKVTLNFGNLLADDGTRIPTTAVRKMRWTYSADLQPGFYQRSEFQVVIWNWTVTGANLTYQVAGPGSRRIEDTDPSLVYSTEWTQSAGNFSGGTIHSTTAAGESVACTYRASQTHELYLGTRKTFNAAQISVTVDNNPAVPLDLYLEGEDVLARIPLGTFSAMDPHTVSIVHSGTDGSFFYFDFLELAVPTGQLPQYAGDTRITLATDWDTDHSLALAPERTARMIQALGYAGRANHYAGALWHYELAAQGFSYASATVTFAGAPSMDTNPITTLWIGLVDSPTPPTAIEHLNLIGDTAASMAKAFELELNSGYTAVWAQANGNVLTIWARTLGAAGDQVTLAAGPTSGPFTAQVSSGNPDGLNDTLWGGNDGNWRTDLAVVPRMNRAARDWSSSFFAALHGYGIDAAAAFSTELGNGDPSPEAGIAQRYPSGNPVIVSTPALQTNFSPASLAFWQQAYLDLATLMSGAGQTPFLQFGEVQWWYFPDDGSGMPFYDQYTTDTFQATYGRPMQVFTTGDVSPAEYPQEAQFLSGLIGTFTSAVMSFVRQTFPDAKFEVLYPPDTNSAPLNQAVNLPAAWNAAALDGFKTENFTFTGNRNLDLANSSILMPMAMGFPRNKSSHLVGITGYTTPWQKEALLSLGQNLESVVLFALDQFCLMNCPVQLPPGARRSVYMG